MNKVKDELKSLSVEQLREKVDEFRSELFTLRLNAQTTHIKDYSQFQKLRKNIARALTILKQKEETH